MNNFAAAVQPNGYLVLSIDAHNFNFLKYLFRLLPADALHPHHHNLAEYEQMLANRNFTITKRLCLKKDFIFGYWVVVAQKTVAPDKKK